MTYIHYGTAEFDRSKFKDIENLPYFPKPKGGLWGSPVCAEFGWKDWCTAEGFRECTKLNSFCFTLNKSNILLIDSIEKCLSVPRLTNQIYDIAYEGDYRRSVYPDFEEIGRMGYDAVEVNISKCGALYWMLYGWDCDSIVVLNPDSVVLVKERIAV